MVEYSKRILSRFLHGKELVVATGAVEARTGGGIRYKQARKI